MVNRTRRFHAVIFSALVIASCGPAGPPQATPVGDGKITIYVKGMTKRLKLM